MLRRFKIVDIEHVSRVRNQEANDLAQVASGYKVVEKKLKNLIKVKVKPVSTSIIRPELSTPKLVRAEELPEFCEIFETLAIDIMTSDDWRRETVEFLRNMSGTKDQKTKYRALRYVIIGNKLFKKTP